MDALIRLRMSNHDVHYAGNLVDGSRMLNLFGDVATELLIRYDGDEGLFRAYSEIDFLEPVYAGDYIEARGRIIKTGTTSRTIEFEAFKVIEPNPEIGETAASVLEEPVLVCKAIGVCVTLKDRQRIGHN